MSEILEARTETRRRRKAERPQEILEAAFVEFSRNGYAMTTLDRVAERAGVTKGTIYVYFENKEHLFISMVREVTKTALDTVHEMLEQQRHVLLALIGRFPNDARNDHLTLASLRLPADLPLSLPSQLVEQRPDVRASQAQLHQASAQIGVAIANRLPQFTLTGDYGSAAVTTAALFTPGALIWSAAASGTQPIFHGFTLLHQQRAAEAAYDQAGAQYRSTVLAAFQNVADALRALQFDAATLKAQRAALRDASETLDLARGQYRLGAITYLILLNAQNSYQQARLAVVQAQAARYADTAALFQALGGGWWNRADVAPNPYTPDPDPATVAAPNTVPGTPAAKDAVQ